ncbi:MULTISPECIES: hypothetical protein [Corynebacterium]|nr:MULTISPECIES: hypothetical protein [Corynebacterium]
MNKVTAIIATTASPLLLASCYPEPTGPVEQDSDVEQSAPSIPRPSP